MAYELKDGDIQITSGNKATSLKIKLGERELDFAIFPKKFDWGTAHSGNLKGLKLMYNEFIKFTVRAVAYYWKLEMEKDNAVKTDAALTIPASKPIESAERKSLLR